MTQAIMLQGTASDVGKSVLVAGLCRIFHQDGLKIAPFKSQNMALNSGITPDGQEMGRAQIFQAEAAGILPDVRMNPVLLKPTSDRKAQVVLMGKVATDMDAVSYHDYKPRLRQQIIDVYHSLAQEYDALVLEGAGSPAEINLRDRDIANMGFAEAVDCPVILVADIDKGGVFAHLVGTLDLLSPSEQARVRGFVINRFRGDFGLLKPGLDWLEAQTGKPVFGVLPYLHGLTLDAEDMLPAQARSGAAHDGGGVLRVVVPALPRISNHTDFDPLRVHPQVEFTYWKSGPVPAADLLILPGSKSVQRDLAWLRAAGWEDVVKRHLRYGGKVIGICGGMQMLGRALDDPLGLEGASGSVPGFGLLDFTTTLQPDKTLKNVAGRLALPGGAAVRGYEIHMGETRGPALASPALALAADGEGEGCEGEGGADNAGGTRADGALSGDGQILATYVHGLFDAPDACAALLAWAGLDGAARIDYPALREASLERLADTIAEHVDLSALYAAFR